jgi:2-oxoglutarate/2-oxoacid ferredoxin oxidoreductase subunit alpha
MPQPRHLVQGNEAVAEGAIAAGARFFAGYPITPSTEIAEVLSRRLPAVGGHFIQMEDEIGSIAAVIGASLAGVKALTATSGPGFSLMQENIGYAAMAQIPCVIVDVMRGGPSTGLPTEPSQGDVMQARWGTHGEHSIIALVPSSVAECFSLTVEAFNLAERFRSPVIILSDATVGHMREAVELPLPEELRIAPRSEPDVAPEDYDEAASTVDKILPRPALGSRYSVHVTGLVYDPQRGGMPATGSPDVAGSLGRYLREKIYFHRDAIERVEEFEMEDAEVALFAYGSVARSAKAAVRWARHQGVKVGLVRPITLWPFPTAAVEHMAAQVRTVIVPEMNLKQMAWEVQAAVRGRAKVVDYGRVDGKLIRPEEIRALIEKEFHYHRFS